MKLCIVLQSLYYNNENTYNKCKESFINNVLNPLKIIFGDNIYIFIITYNNNKIIQLINDYEPVDLMILPTSYRNYNSMSFFLEKSFEITENFKYDYILITRFDIYFHKLLDFKKININKCIFGYKDNLTKCDINFILANKKYTYDLKTYINSNRYIYWLNKVIGDENVEYICKNNNYSDFYSILN